MPSSLTKNLLDENALERFLARIPDFAGGGLSHAQLVPYFGYFISEETSESDISPKQIRACYEAAAMPIPANITDVMKKSHAFISTSDGTKLHRDVRNRIEASLTPKLADAQVSVEPSLAPDNASDKARTVVVVHGRDTGLRDDTFALLRSLGLAPVEWSEAVRKTGRGSPYTGEVLDALFRDAQAVVVIISPDEHVEIRGDLQTKDSPENEGWQPRPNVFIEAGIALAKDEPHTILVQIGKIRPASDLTGRNVIRFDGSATHRHELAERLRTAGCAVSTSGTDWLRTGHFKISSGHVTQKRGKTK